jgi:hypothetical protein
MLIAKHVDCERSLMLTPEVRQQNEKFTVVDAYFGHIAKNIVLALPFSKGNHSGNGALVEPASDAPVELVFEDITC